MTFLTLTLIFSVPTSGRSERLVAMIILSNSFSVACSKPSMVAARSAAKTGLRQASNLSPGQFADEMAAKNPFDQIAIVVSSIVLAIFEFVALLML